MRFKNCPYCNKPMLSLAKEFKMLLEKDIKMVYCANNKCPYLRDKNIDGHRYVENINVKEEE